MYYLRTKAATDAIKFTVDKAKLTEPSVVKASKELREVEPVREAVMSGPVTTSGMTAEEEAQAQITCSLEDPEGCEMCSG